MNDVFVGVLVALAAIALGLRITGLLIPRVHPFARLLVAAILGAAMTLATLRICDGYGVHDLGLGLLVSLSPVGAFDLAKWWFRWKQ